MHLHVNKPIQYISNFLRSLHIHMWLCTKLGKHLTSDPADGLKFTLRETPALHRRGGAVRVGGIPKLTAWCGLLLFIHQTEISNF